MWQQISTRIYLSTGFLLLFVCFYGFFLSLTTKSEEPDSSLKLPIFLDQNENALMQKS